MGLFLRDCPKLILEWSLSVRPRHISDQDRVTCWVEGVQPGDFAAMSRLLAAINAPALVLQQQQATLSTAIRQGISVALSHNRVEWRLYLHTREPGQGRDQYRSYRWAEISDVQMDSYRFYFSPETPEGDKPLDLVHPIFAAAAAALTQHTRLSKMSGFWLRSRAEQVLQVDFTFPWHPPLVEFVPTLQALCQTLNAPAAWLTHYAGYPIRHLAFSGHSKEPAFTIYFSAPVPGPWPPTLAALKERVNQQGQTIHDWLENNLFAHVPPETTQPNLAVGKFYDTHQIEPWRQVLGPNLHYHFGLFEAPDGPVSSEFGVSSSEFPEFPQVPLSSPKFLPFPTDEIAAEAAFERAVSVLYPFVPERGRVYDIGCGWGGPARQLLRDLDCRVEGITASRTQFRYCASQGLPVRYGDVETTLPAGTFDCMLLLESLSHVQDKLRLLKVLRLFGKKLIIRDHCQDVAPASLNFGGSMVMNSSTELRQMVEQAGWNIIHWRNRRPESMPSVAIWHSRLQNIPPGDDIHLETLRAFCQRVLSCGPEWATANPLIECVAE
jgi:cyclopropane fatty-acyl-phospholipid synthase-like methyltransferase